MISIVNYGSGNIAAIANLLRLSNLPHEIADDAAALKKADRILLPGVGAFDPTLDLFRRSGLEEMLRERTAAGAALLGICVGMQVLADSSEEGKVKGLGFVPGRVRRFDPQTIPGPSKVPHMGWNTIRARNNDHPLIRNTDASLGFYFLHSYYFECANAEDVIAETDHGRSFSCVVGRGRIFGIQFHPEKSHHNGVQIFRNFMEV